MLARGLLLLLLVFQAGVVLGAEDIETRRERREREQKELLLQSLIKAKARLPEFFAAANSPTRCAEIEYYLRKMVKMHAEVHELALIVETHDPKLVPTRVYRVKYEDRKGKEHVKDFIMQQAGADWIVRAHVEPVEIREAPAEDAETALQQ
jgi:hypothetical protein